VLGTIPGVVDVAMVALPDALPGSSAGAHARGPIQVPVPEPFRSALDHKANRAYADLATWQLSPQYLDYRLSWLPSVA
jgi:hypothetical protein